MKLHPYFAEIAARMQVRYRVWTELAYHQHEAYCRQRDAGMSPLPAWRCTRVPPAIRTLIVAEGLASLAPASPRQWRWVPGAAPALGALAMAAVLVTGPRAPELRASMLGHLPVPAGAQLLQTGFVPAGTVAALHRYDTGVYQYSTAVWESPQGRRLIRVVRMSPELMRLLGLPADVTVAPSLHRFPLVLDHRRFTAATVIPARLDFIFPTAQAWLPDSTLLQSGPRTPLYVVSLAPLPGLRASSFGALFLEDLSYPRWLLYGVSLVWLLLALWDIGRMAPQSALLQIARAAAYWVYAWVNIVVFLLLMMAVSGYIIANHLPVGLPLTFLTALAVGVGTRYALQWCVRDQRFRCRTCLRHLRMPLHQGRTGSILLMPPATAYICPHGHGKLVVPDFAGQPQPAEQWSFSGDWWQELVATAS